jgi:osmotically-inducible protein OsmY
VTLSGTVETRYEKRLAEDIADAVSGVQDIHNRLRVVQK